LQYWYALFLADTEHLMQALAIDVAGGDNQVRDRLRFDDGTQISHSAANGHAVDSLAMQPRIVVKKANGTEPKARILQQFAQDKLPTSSSAVDERCRASDVVALLEIVQDTTRTPYAHDQGVEQERIKQEKSERIHRCQAHEGN
jgi:hypothetical protein